VVALLVLSRVGVSVVERQYDACRKAYELIEPDRPLVKNPLLAVAVTTYAPGTPMRATDLEALVTTMSLSLGVCFLVWLLREAVPFLKSLQTYTQMSHSSGLRRIWLPLGRQSLLIAITAVCLHSLAVSENLLLSYAAAAHAAGVEGGYRPPLLLPMTANDYGHSGTMWAVLIAAICTGLLWASQKIWNAGDHFLDSLRQLGTGNTIDPRRANELARGSN